MDQDLLQVDKNHMPPTMEDSSHSVPVALQHLSRGINNLCLKWEKDFGRKPKVSQVVV